MIDTSKMMANGKLSLDDLYEKSNEAVIKTLVKIRGIGPWTAESLLLFGMGREDLLPVADVGLQNAVQKLHDLRKKPSPEEMRKLGKAWSPYRSYASLYLWESLGNHTVSAT